MSDYGPRTHGSGGSGQLQLISTKFTLPQPQTPGQILSTYFHVKHPEGRCEGFTRRGTRCRFRACTILVRFTDGKQEGQHSACKIHRNTWRWWW